LGYWGATDVVVGLLGTGPLGVLLMPDDHQVRADEGNQKSGDQQNVDREQARDEILARETAAEDFYVPTTGIDSMIPWAMRRPVPDNRSSGSE